MPLRAAVFDLDGTLVDTEAVWSEALSRWLASHGKTYEPSFQKNLMGKPAAVGVRLLMERFGLYGDVETLLRERESFFDEALRERGFAEKPGACGFVQALADAGVKIALATSGGRAYAERALTAIACRQCFSVLVSGEDVLHGKPAPDIYAKAVEKLGVGRDQAVAFEDAPSGIESALAAGLKVVGMVDPRYVDGLPGATMEAHSFGELSFERLQALFS